MAHAHDLGKRGQFVFGDGGERSRAGTELRGIHQVVGDRGRLTIGRRCRRGCDRGWQIRYIWNEEIGGSFRDRCFAMNLHTPPRSGGKQRGDGHQAHDHAQSGMRAAGKRQALQKWERERGRRTRFVGRRLGERRFGEHGLGELERLVFKQVIRKLGRRLK